MSAVSRDVTDEQLLALVRMWIDALSREEYDRVFAALGYGMAFGRPGPEAIRDDIKRYRAPDYFPGIEEFVVSDWRTALGGNPSPTTQIRWYKPSTLRLIGAVDYDLPLNGKWSDLTANFVLFESENPKEGYILGLEDISSPEREQGESAA
jgi:hypothetical protein